MTKRKLAGLAAGLAIALIWGFSFISIKIALRGLAPVSLGFLRFVLASMALWALKAVLAPGDRLPPKDLALSALAGLLGVSLYFLCENNGVRLLGASEASLVIGTIPVLSLLCEAVANRKPLSPRELLGALLSSLGVWFLMTRPTNGQTGMSAPQRALAWLGLGSSSNPIGYLYMLGASLAWVAYAFVSKGLFSRHKKISVVFWQSVFGCLGFLPFIWPESASWRLPGLDVWLQLGFLAIFCSALGYWLYALSCDYLGLGASSLFINLIPLVSVLASFFFLGERLSPRQIAGGGLAVAGVFLATVVTAKPEAESPRQAPKKLGAAPK